MGRLQLVSDVTGFCSFTQQTAICLSHGRWNCFSLSRFCQTWAFALHGPDDVCVTELVAESASCLPCRGTRRQHVTALGTHGCLRIRTRLSFSCVLGLSCHFQRRGFSPNIVSIYCFLCGLFPIRTSTPLPNSKKLGWERKTLNSQMLCFPGLLPPV